MKSQLLLLLSALLITSANSWAQQPFEIIPRTGTTIELQTPVGTETSTSICVVRVWPGIPHVTVTGPSNQQFSTDLLEPGNSPGTKLVIFDNATDAINDTVCFTVTFTAPEEPGLHTDTLAFTEAGVRYWLVLSGEALPREQVQPLIVSVETTSAKVGEVATVRITAQTPVPNDAASALVVMRYNATVLAPEFDPVSDQTEGGDRLSSFRTSVEAGSQGLIASIPFRVLLGNSSSGELNVAITFEDAEQQPIERSVQVNQGTVSVIDTEGLLVNADAGPLSLRLSSMPVRRGGASTLSYTRGSDPARLYFINDIGAVVADMSSSVSAESGSFAIPVSLLATGTYTIQLVGGRHRFIHRMVVE